MLISIIDTKVKYLEIQFVSLLRSKGKTPEGFIHYSFRFFNEVTSNSYICNIAIMNTGRICLFLEVMYTLWNTLDNRSIDKNDDVVNHITSYYDGKYKKFKRDIISGILLNDLIADNYKITLDIYAGR